MGLSKYRKNKSDADIYINPLQKGYTPASFQSEAIDSMVLRGEQAAREQWHQLQALRHVIYGNDSDTVCQHPKRLKPPHAESYPIANIRIEGIGGEEMEWIRRKIDLQEQSSVNPEEIDRTLAMLQGLNIFSRVEYRLENEEPFDLVFMLEPRKEHRINIGARFDTQDLASVIANISNKQQFATRHHYALTGRISRNPYLEMSYTYGHLFGAKMGFTYRLASHDFDVYSGKQELDALEFMSHSLAGYYTRDVGNLRLMAGAQVEYYHYQSDLYEQAGNRISRSSDHFFNYFVSFTMDTYDRRYYPTHDGRLQVQGILHTDDGIHYANDNPFGETAFHADCALRLSSRLYLSPKLKGRFLFGSTIPAIYQNCAGGDTDAYYLPGQMAWETAQHVHLLNRNVMVGQLCLRYRLKGKLYLSALGEYGKESRKTSRIFCGDDLWGCAMRASYDFVLGPVSIQTNYSNLDKNVGIYISAGFMF